MGEDVRLGTVRRYTALCREYGATPNPGVLTALRFRLPTVRPSGNFHDVDMLPLVDLLLMSSDAAGHVRALDLAQASRDGPEFGRCGISSHGAVALAALLRRSGADESGGAAPVAHIDSVELRNNAIGAFGGVAIAEALKARGS